jgi:hypothetical protein
MSPEDRAILISDITAAIKGASTLTDEEHRWVKMAIQKEAQTIELRKAIIEKTLTGLVWLCILGLGSIIATWATQHGYKP